MINRRRADRKRRYKGLEREEPPNGRKETGGSGIEEGEAGKTKTVRRSGIEEGEAGKKKTKKKRNKNKKRKWRRKEQPISTTSAHKIEGKEDDEEEVSYKKKPSTRRGMI